MPDIRTKDFKVKSMKINKHRRLMKHQSGGYENGFVRELMLLWIIPLKIGVEIGNFYCIGYAYIPDRICSGVYHFAIERTSP